MANANDLQFTEPKTKDRDAVWVSNKHGRPVQVEAWRLKSTRAGGEDLLNKNFRLIPEDKVEEAVENWDKNSHSKKVHDKYVALEEKTKKKGTVELLEVVEAITKAKEDKPKKPKKEKVEEKASEDTEE